MSDQTLSLNVIFHGLCVFVGQDQTQPNTDIEVLLPDVAGHSYLAGPWLAETGIARDARMSLTGVVKGDAIFDRRRNLMVLPEKKNSFPRTNVKEFASLTFPRPDTIYSLRPVALDVDGPQRHLQGASLNSVFKRQDGKIWQATVQVFRYFVEDENRVVLSNHRWIPAFVNGFANLHVFAEPATPQPVGHSISEFGEGSRLFQGLDLTRVRASMLSQFDFVPPGILKEELEDLVPRTRRMALLGRYRRLGESADLAWDDEDPFSGNTTACVWGGDGS
jgi:hypothetical protein